MALKKSQLYLITALSSALLIIFITFIGFLFVPWWGSAEKQIEFEIEHGSHLKQISDKLEEHQLAGSTSFYLAARITGRYKSFKSGYYQIEDKQSLWSLMNLLQSGKSRLVSVTVVEGLRNKEIFTRLRASGLLYTKGYESLHRSQSYLEKQGLPKNAGNLEGFLFPETYKLSINLNPEDTLAVMVKMFFQKLPENYIEKAKKVGLSFYQAVILASIIEKETGAAHERPLISSVFHNRMQKGMRLQTDPTVIYGIRNFNGNLTRKHLRTYTPYNTYRIKGLPPTPIASPGYHSLLAAVEPAKSKYLYFVAKGNGEHYFSSTLKEHNRAVNKYQKQPRNRKNYRSYKSQS